MILNGDRHWLLISWYGNVFGSTPTFTACYNRISRCGSNGQATDCKSVSIPIWNHAGSSPVTGSKSCWSNWLSRHPLKVKTTGSSPVQDTWQLNSNGIWCNGNTWVSGTHVLGSSPGIPANYQRFVDSWQVSSHGLMDRLPLFHSGGRGSIPLGSTIQ